MPEVYECICGCQQFIIHGGSHIMCSDCDRDYDVAGTIEDAGTFNTTRHLLCGEGARSEGDEGS